MRSQTKNVFLVFRKPMQWTESHNLAQIREILLFEPWLHRHGTSERGQIWKRIAESLNKIQEPFFKVDDRLVRDHYKLLEKAFNKKTSNEEKATGIAPLEESELDQGIRNIVEQFHDFYSKLIEKKHQKELKTNKDTEIAEEFRNISLETFGGTKRLTRNCRLERGMISHLQSRRKEDLVLKHSHTCDRKMNKN